MVVGGRTLIVRRKSVPAGVCWRNRLPPYGKGTFQKKEAAERTMRSTASKLLLIYYEQLSYDDQFFRFHCIARLNADEVETGSKA